MDNYVVIIPYYNDKDRLLITIDKIYNFKVQNNLSFKVYIIDDGSKKENYNCEF